MSEIYLIQTDTTVGFLSKDYQNLNIIKERNINQDCLMVVSSLRELKELVRVPNSFKKAIRYSSKTTYIYNNKKAIRVVNKPIHKNFLKLFGFFYSTSANKTKNSFNFEFAYNKSDIIVFDSRGFFEDSPSKIYKLYKTKKVCIR